MSGATTDDSQSSIRPKELFASVSTHFMMFWGPFVSPLCHRFAVKYVFTPHDHPHAITPGASQTSRVPSRTSLTHPRHMRSFVSGFKYLQVVNSVEKPNVSCILLCIQP